MFDIIFNRYMNLLLFYFRAAFRLFYYITNDTYHVAFWNAWLRFSNDFNREDRVPRHCIRWVLKEYICYEHTLLKFIHKFSQYKIEKFNPSKNMKNQYFMYPILFSVCLIFTWILFNILFHIKEYEVNNIFVRQFRIDSESRNEQRCNANFNYF